MIHIHDPQMLVVIAVAGIAAAIVLDIVVARFERRRAQRQARAAVRAMTAGVAPAQHIGVYDPQDARDAYELNRSTLWRG